MSILLKAKGKPAPNAYHHPSTEAKAELTSTGSGRVHDDVGWHGASLNYAAINSMPMQRNLIPKQATNSRTKVIAESFSSEQKEKRLSF
jgi:hypothetical protein